MLVVDVCCHFELWCGHPAALSTYVLVDRFAVDREFTYIHIYIYIYMYIYAPGGQSVRTPTEAESPCRGTDFCHCYRVASKLLEKVVLGITQLIHSSLLSELLQFPLPLERNFTVLERCFVSFNIY